MTNANWRRERKTGSNSMAGAALIVRSELFSGHNCSRNDPLRAYHGAACSFAAWAKPGGLDSTRPPSWRLSAAQRGGSHFQDIVLQTFAAVPERRAEVCSR